MMQSGALGDAMMSLGDRARAIERINVIRDELRRCLTFVRRDIPSPVFEAMLDNMAATQYAGEQHSSLGPG